MQFVELMVMSGKETTVVELLKKKIELLIQSDASCCFLKDLIVCHFRKGVSSVIGREGTRYRYEQGIKSYLFIGADLLRWTEEQLVKLYYLLKENIPFVIGPARKWSDWKERLFTESREMEQLASALDRELSPEIRLVLPENEVEEVSEANEGEGDEHELQDEYTLEYQSQTQTPFTTAHTPTNQMKSVLHAFRMKASEVGLNFKECVVKKAKQTQRVFSLSYEYVYDLVKRHLPEVLKPDLFIPAEWFVKWLPVLIDIDLDGQQQA
ncbi:hypothetical protein [Brevibacillus dissolubilis]|uniref:hypothetical protein n=1 Tax=Brevibacillus dissolubilis TaxID=1844116 RepID=UPI0011168197|nr:hypothetical protein [Brevibacillus dissolubilis]